MLDNCDNQQRWRQVDALIGRWLKERQSLIVQFCGVSGVRELGSQQTPARLSRLGKFCQILVDYLSAGHFEIHYQLLREAEAFNDGTAELAQALLPPIDATTETLLAFNDRYAEIADHSDHTLLARDLSELGEVLAVRFELEDRMIAKMHRVHSEVA